MANTCTRARLESKNHSTVFCVSSIDVGEGSQVERGVKDNVGRE